MSDWPSNTPIDASKFLLCRGKACGGGTWTCVGDPGCAHSGTTGADVAGAEGACACSGCGAVQSIRMSSEAKHDRLSTRRSMKISIAKNFSRTHTLRWRNVMVLSLPGSFQLASD